MVKMITRSDPKEVLEAVGYTVARGTEPTWRNDDIIEFKLWMSPNVGYRGYVRNSTEDVMVCRHNDWKSICGDCMNVVARDITYEQAVEERKQRDEAYRQQEEAQRREQDEEYQKQKTLRGRVKKMEKDTVTVMEPYTTYGDYHEVQIEKNL